jgi:hypothetical protein
MEHVSALLARNVPLRPLNRRVTQLLEELALKLP